MLFITGYVENAALNHGHLDPGMQVMTKPFAMEALATRIRSMMELGSPMIQIDDDQRGISCIGRPAAAK